MRTDVLPSIPEPLLVWTARLEPGQSEWLHEREWRIPAAQVRLGQMARLAAVVVGDQTWHPSFQTNAINPWTGRLAYADRVAPLAAGMQRWCWDSTRGRLLALPPWHDEFRDA
ncbi:hypothetical protein M6D93_12315 [Jatrophihabitans telluris]|uniref:RES domain-containing protein n=1 Tax=Jatrophihabitans telluris TaxID=2038343 RepID=A0ABY4QTP9_9ACTN|nr:hypothetical protein [Jatrophihabitans telluris]UQX87086.1 hypothetical protein M6D93_12315 [Jatrophihabitans telluris]